MKTSKYFLLCSFTVFLIGFYSCSNQSVQNEDIDSAKTEIQKVIDAHFEYLDSYELDKLLSLQTEDIIEMPPNVTRLVGKDEYAEHVQPYLDFFKTLKSKEMSFPVSEFVVTGDWAFQIGTYKVKFTLQDDSVMEDEGNFVWIFKKDNTGNWNWARVISNSTKPLN